MKSVMSHSFSNIPRVQIPRSTFSRSHGYKTTMDAGYLVPILCDEVLPGDTFKCRANLFGRLATPITPVMDNLFLDVQYFFVPSRLLWTNWERFMGAKDNPDDTTSYLLPVITIGDSEAVTGSLADYFGVPVNFTSNNGVEVNALPFRAYNLIWNEWYRDQNLQDSIDVPKDDGPDAYGGTYALLKRGKRHDYFTSCLPWPQKGDAIEMPLGTSAPVISNGSAIQLTDGTKYGTLVQGDSNGGRTGVNSAVTDTIGASVSDLWGGADQLKALGFRSTHTGLEVNLSTATAATVNSLREAFQLQRFLERDARGGTRYVELLLSHFGVQSPDFRLQRPEYLGGSTSRIAINSVAQTSESGTTPQGNLAAFGVVGDTTGSWAKSFVEHGYIIGLASVRADLTYQQGLDRMWSRRTRYDFYWPTLSNLGEQAVLNKEIYFQGDGDTNDNKTFGYQERYAEYRYARSMITGKFRSSDAQSLDVWHLAQEFGSLPTLGDTFIQENPPLDRVIAVPSEPHLLLDCYFDIQATRPMPVYSVPGMIDHF